MRALVLLWMLLVPSVALADEFGGWRFTPPAGASKEAKTTVVSYTTFDQAAKTFCQIRLFTARAPSGDDFQKEWNDFVERPYKFRDAGQLVHGKFKNMAVTGRTFTLLEGDNTFSAAFYLLQPPGGVSSAMLLSTTPESLQKCPIGAFLDSLVLVNVPAAPAQPAQPAQPVQPAQDAGAPPIAGTWSNGVSNYVGGVSTGSIKSQYTFKPDGTYEFYRETWGGSSSSAWYFTMLETGTWTLTGDQLAVNPKKTVGTEYNTLKKTTKSVKIPLEPATYTAKTVYFSGLQEWNLVLTIAKPTDRDGAFAANPSYPSSYLFNARNNNAFRYKPK